MAASARTTAARPERTSVGLRHGGQGGPTRIADALGVPAVTFEVAHPQASADVTLTGAAGTGTIRDDDHERSFGDRLDGFENHAAGGSVPVRREVVPVPPASGAVTVRCETVDGVVDAATSGEDCESPSDTLTCAPGETERTIEIVVHDDDSVESGARVGLLPSHVTAPAEVGGAISTARAVRNDIRDDRYALSIDSPDVDEGLSGSTDLTFTARPGKPADVAVQVDDTDTAGGTAAAGDDYVPLRNGGPAVARGETGTETTVDGGDVVPTRRRTSRSGSRAPSASRSAAPGEEAARSSTRIGAGVRQPRQRPAGGIPGAVPERIPFPCARYSPTTVASSRADSRERSRVSDARSGRCAQWRTCPPPR